MRNREILTVAASGSLDLVGPCTQVHGPGLTPAMRGRGGGDAGSLLPGVLPTQLAASHARARTDSPCR